MPQTTLPRTIGRYEIVREIGRGAMGIVYEGRDLSLMRPVALKTLLLEPIAEELRETFEKRFYQEARAAAGLQHPCIVVVYEIGIDAAADAFFMSLEFLRGRTLEDVIESGPLPWREALRIASRLADALSHAHENGIVHRDIKPGNVMILKKGEPKIMDFGVAKLDSSKLTSQGDVLGSPGYMAPEQALEARVDARSDLFSLGTVLYEALTGKRAFGRGTFSEILMRLAYEHPTPPSLIVKDLPPAVDHIVAHALAKNPDERYANADQMVEDIEDALTDRPLRHTAGRGTRPIPGAASASTPGSCRSSSMRPSASTKSPRVSTIVPSRSMMAASMPRGALTGRPSALRAAGCALGNGPARSCQRLSHGVDDGAVVALAEDGAAGHEGVGAGVGHAADVVGLDAAVHLQPDVLAAGVDAATCRFHLAQGAINKGLSAKAGVDAHDQDQVDLLDQPVQHVQRRGRVEHQPHLAARRLDGLHAAVRVRAGVGVKADQIGAGLREGLGQRVHRLHHHVHVQRHRLPGGGDRVRLDGLADHRPEREVGHVVVVHDVEMDPVGAGGDDALHLLAQPREVGREDGGRDAVGGAHDAGLSRSYHAGMPTYQFHVEVQPEYLPEQSEPAQGRYGFAYTITVLNTGQVAAQLVSRHWIIADGRGHTEEVKGLGVVGQQPLLQPGEAFQYTSGCQLRTPSGTMHGSYFCVAEDGERFEVAIPLFVLDASGADGGSARVLH